VLDVAAQVATITINIPLNNRVKSLIVSYMDSDMKKLERDHFESTWNKWNLIASHGCFRLCLYVPLGSFAPNRFSLLV
jgi:hypothetical protein